MENKERDYKEERFEFALFVNDNIICKRNFKIYNFIEGSMNTLDFKLKMDEIVNLIDDDLKSKSRVYTWYYFNPANPEPGDEFDSKLIEPWVCTFKFVVSDNKKEVITKIWDGYAYPKSIREKVDLSNKNVRVVNREGQVNVFDKESFFTNAGGRLTFEQEVLKGMIMDKPDVLLQITKKICEACSVSRDELKDKKFDSRESEKYLTDYTTFENFFNTEAIKKDDGSVVYKKVGKPKRYAYSLALANKKVESDWARILANKSKKYFRSLYY